MKYIKFVLIGFVFGLALYKGEAFSWYRIQEMFRFQSFHMYGIILSASFVGGMTVLIIRKLNLTDVRGNKIVLSKKPLQPKRQLIGSVLFGMGWALTGFCVGPIFVILGYLSYQALILFLGALFGAYLFAWLSR
ncbi:MAG: YeeE/YedE thiosulfate transporter family protein [Flavobacteriaceae bacterium]